MRKYTKSYKKSKTRKIRIECKTRSSFQIGKQITEEVVDRIANMFLLANQFGTVSLSILGDLPSRRNQGISNGHIHIKGVTGKALTLIIKVKDHRKKIELMITSKELDVTKVEEAFLALNLLSTRRFAQRGYQSQVDAELGQLISISDLHDEALDSLAELATQKPPVSGPEKPEEATSGASITDEGLMMLLMAFAGVYSKSELPFDEQDYPGKGCRPSQMKLRNLLETALALEKFAGNVARTHAALLEEIRGRSAEELRG